MAELTDKFVPTHADAARFLGVKVATIRHATPGIQITGKNNRVATFYGQHPPNPWDYLGKTWWHIRQHEVTDG